MKKALAAILILLIGVGWAVSLSGIGPSFKDEIKLGLDLKGGVYVVMEAQTDATGAELADLMEQTQLVIEGRVNQMGLSEPIVTIEGEKKIRVELPGAEDAEGAIETIGKTAQLQFVLGDGSVVVDGSQVKNAGIGKDERGFNAVNLEFDTSGAAAFEEATRKAVNGEIINAETGLQDRVIYIVLDENVISFPEVSSVITGGRAQITGSFTDDEMTELALLIRAGALPVGLLEVQTSLVGPSLGIDSLQNSLVAGVIGVGLILILMLLMYRIMGLVANIGLALYILVVFWVLAILSAVLNLPGIAGLILSVGMAVDSNVIIFARIKEEFTEGKTLRVAVDTGFRRAMGTIIDSQLTTMIAGVVLYQFGTGPVRGFAMTLMIGIIVSVLTSVLVTQFLLKTAVETKSLAKPNLFGVVNKRMEMSRELSYLKHRKYFYIIAAVVIIIGVSSGVIRGFNWGIDFTGGTMIQIDMEQVVTLDEVQDVLNAHDLDASIVHAGDGNEEVIIRTTKALDTMQRQSVLGDIFTAFGIDESNVLAVEQFSPSVGTLLKTNAIRAILIAAACMLVYIIIRFEWKFGLAAVAALIHDVLIMVAFYGLFQIPINNPFIAAVLIVVGYSINDTIVVFDRIRENRRIYKKNRIDDLIDKSINQTIVRSLMTSITTVVAIVPLLILGGGSIREFVLPLMIGILAGAVSSITIASPVYYQLDRLVNRPRYQGK